MSVMQNSQVQELALALAELLELDLQGAIDPYEPVVIIAALEVLFPEAEAQLRVIKTREVQEQWNDVLEFIEINMLQGERLEIQALGQQEITDIYTLLIDFTQQAMQQNGEFQEQLSPQDMQQRQEEIKAEYKKQQKASRQKEQKKRQQKVTNKQLQKAAKPKKVEEKKSKDKSKSKEKSKPKSSSKGKDKAIPKNQPSQKEGKPAPKPIPKKSPSSSKPKPKKQPIPDQPMQNQAIRQITTAMQCKRKQNNHVSLKDPKSTEEVLKAKRQFDYYLNQFKREGKDKQRSAKQTNQKKGILDQYFLKALQKRQKNIQETVANQQLRYFLALRDKKVAFINKIHKLTETLERERIVEKEKEQRRLMQEERAKTQAKIQQGNALFQKNMELLKDNYRAMRQKNELQSYDERAICKEMEECMKKKKLGQLQELKLLWQQQNMKLNNIMGDEQKLKSKLIDIYRKNRP